MADWFLKNKIRDDKVTVFVKAGCPYCRNATEMLKQYNFLPGHLQVFDINKSREAWDYFQTTGQGAVPCVFIGRQCIGGLCNLENMRCSLPRMLQRIGALQ
ncbi:GLRX1 protein, partial [Sagittarius serpentarius]|nr:GLRX1 protein [Sagittarius serpentarius]